MIYYRIISPNIILPISVYIIEITPPTTEVAAESGKHCKKSTTDMHGEVMELRGTWIVCSPANREGGGSIPSCTCLLCY
jgi:hypothetical protein